MKASQTINLLKWLNIKVGARKRPFPFTPVRTRAALGSAWTASLFATLSLGATAPDFGPFAHQFPLTLDPGHATEALGPLFSATTAKDWTQWSLSPFLSYTHNPELDAEEFDVLYPFLTYDRFGGESKLRFFLLTTLTGGRTQAGHASRRFTVFPFLFLQRSAEPGFTYSAVFPLWGTIRDRLNRDEISFRLFPVYSRSVRKDVVTRNYLYPLLHVRAGEQLQGWQLWPFFGREVRNAFSRTNDQGDVEAIPGHRKGFGLWPFYLYADTGLGTTNPQTARVYFPFHVSMRSPAKDVRSWFWPFFNVIEDRENGYREWQLPFPFVDIARGKGKTTDRFFPFYSRARTARSESGFLLWPVYKFNRVYAPPLARERERSFFFLYSHLRETNTLTGTIRHRVDGWPLFTQRREHDGRSRLQVLALLEPFLPENKAIARAWSPLWSLWRQESDPRTGARSQSLLWNLYRRDMAPGRKKASLLFGLFQYQSTPDRRRWRIAFIPWSRPPRLATPDR